jgi:TIR domain
MSIDVFISYTHADRELKDKITKHLSGLRNNGEINDWFDGDIIAGTEWETQITDHLNNAQIILLLISDEFLASKFCYHTEMKRALARHDAGEAKVIPIILRPCDWKKTPFGKLQALPTSGKAITHWRIRDDAYMDIVRGIKKAISDLQKNLLQPTNEIADDKQSTVAKKRRTSSSARPASQIEPSGRNSSITNNIGSVGGKHNTVNQGRTIHTTVTNHYGKPKEHDATE